MRNLLNSLISSAFAGRARRGWLGGRAAFNRRRKPGIALIVATILALAGADRMGWLRPGRTPRSTSAADGDYDVGADRARYDGKNATVTRVVDGDTVVIDIPDRAESTTRVRLWGIDTPEIGHTPGERDMYFGPQAAEYARLKLTGKRVTIELEPTRDTRDRHGRLLAYLRLPDENVTINERLLSAGLAYADSRYAHQWRDRFAQLERTARRQRVGLWAGVRPEDMPDWRRKKEADGRSRRESSRR